MHIKLCIVYVVTPSASYLTLFHQNYQPRVCPIRNHYPQKHVLMDWWPNNAYQSNLFNTNTFPSVALWAMWKGLQHNILS